jgi:hypothetical protein
MNRSFFHILALLISVILIIESAHLPAQAIALRPGSGSPTGSSELSSVPGPAGHGHNPAGAVTGPQKVLVLRVYFADYAAETRYTKTEVEGFFDELNTLWQHNSYDQISIDYEVSELFQMPDNRSEYIDDSGTPDTCAEDSGGDLSCGGKYLKILTDAVNNAPDGLDWSNLDDVLVVMAETDPSQFHRGQSLCPCVLPAGPGSDDEMNVDGAIFSENPSETDVQVWGRWAHEIGHAFQQGGPGHPSSYNSEFELMDSNYPGQTGVFEKQENMAYPGWLPVSKYQLFTPSCDVGPDTCTGLGGGSALIWAEEYDPDLKPNIQAVKAYITDDLYYLISVRRRVNGDELNGQFPDGIPDEGVLIERVNEAPEEGDQWVTVMGKGGNRDDLWNAGDQYSHVTDGIQIIVPTKISDDDYLVYVTYDTDAALQPDVMLYPWTSPPGNTWETTDMWIDSPVNGYGTYRYGTWNDLSGNPVPVGNGDEPTIGQTNRLYARVRNIGGSPATNVVVHFDITDPPGMGINDDTSWDELGSVDSTDFAGLANIDPGEYEDVYIEWTPDYAIPEEDLENGNFAFHTCLRVRLDQVVGETVLGNQDGDMEQENVFYFQAPEDAGDVAYDVVIHLHNDDPSKPRFYYLHSQDDLPDGWALSINQGEQTVEVAPNSIIDIPVQITSAPEITQTVGSTFGADIFATSLNLLVSDLDPNDQHPENQILGGVRVETRVVQNTTLECVVKVVGGTTYVTCHLGGIGPYYDPTNPPKIMIEGVGRTPTGDPIYLTDTMTLLFVDPQGNASGTLAGRASLEDVVQVIGLFGGTSELASAGTRYILVNPKVVYLPLTVK